MNQRWRNRVGSFREDEAVINPRAYDVAVLAEDREPKAFVEAHHYSRSYPAARYRVGLYRRDVLAGVAVFSQPTNNKTTANVFPSAENRCTVELGRFVLLDDVPANGETWFLARAFDLLRSAGVRGVVSFSDPVPRSTLEGAMVMPGHVGTIYQAFNGRCLGRGTARTLRLLPDGRVFSDRSSQKVRTGERGWRYAADLLVEFGAERLLFKESGREWLAAWLPRLTRSVRHPGNWKYAWALDRRLRKELPAGVVYPKVVDAA